MLLIIGFALKEKLLYKYKLVFPVHFGVKWYTLRLCVLGKMPMPMMFTLPQRDHRIISRFYLH